MAVAPGFTHSIGVLYKSTEGGQIANTTDSFTGNAQEGLDISIPGNSTDFVVPIAVTVANIVSMCFISENTDVTAHTYASAVLKDTIDLKAAKQSVWDIKSSGACPFLNNLDTIKVTNTSSNATRLRLAILLTS